MTLAQKLYEGKETAEGAVGLITYMRTDSTRLASPAVAEAREIIGQRYGHGLRAPKPNVYKSRSGAQDRPRGHPAPPAPCPHPRGHGQVPERRRAQALPPHLAALCGQPDGPGPVSTAPRPTSPRASPEPASGPTARSRPSPASPRCTRRARTKATSRSGRACCLPWKRARSSSWRASSPSSTSPSRRRAFPRPAWSRSWRKRALAAPPPTRPSSPPWWTAST